MNEFISDVWKQKQIKSYISLTNKHNKMKRMLQSITSIYMPEKE